MTKINRKSFRREQQAFSLLEMIMATTLVAGTVVPALSVIRDAMADSRQLHKRQMLATYAVQVLEDQISYVARTWTNATPAGDFAADGHPDIRFNATRSDAVADGGIVNQLMSVQVTVYEDVNGNDTLDSGEITETYRTKVAQLNTYLNEEI